MSQVTSVSQFSAVQPTDWAFQALQSLVERYGCIAGYPNGTYRGNRALTRYEFAAGLNACLDRVNELIATATANIVTREDLATIQRLQEEISEYWRILEAYLHFLVAIGLLPNTENDNRFTKFRLGRFLNQTNSNNFKLYSNKSTYLYA